MATVIESETISPEIELARLRQALMAAVDTIQSYEMDMRQLGRDSPEHLGYCQGEMYLTALERIGRLLKGESQVYDAGFARKKLSEFDEAVRLNKYLQESFDREQAAKQP